MIDKEDALKKIKALTEDNNVLFEKITEVIDQLDEYYQIHIRLLEYDAEGH